MVTYTRPKMVISGETADISPFFEFCYWNWVRFGDKDITFPDDVLVLGKYHGLNIDVGHAIMQCVTKANGKVEDHSTVHLLTPEDCVRATLHK
jgi:hypothetical protein